jgi:hypothetical protein
MRNNTATQKPVAPPPTLPTTLLLREQPISEYARKLQEAGYES